jgi:L-ascorbate metabolism protein UlaG (beta-lactamase superfamily)
MKLTYYGYNAFVIQGAGKTIILDPGRDLHWRRLASLIPPPRWAAADLVLVTHGDADHADYAAQVARASSAPIVCGRALARKWRQPNLTTVPVAPGETVEAAGVQVHAVPVQHGPAFSLLGRSLKLPFVGPGGVGLLLTLEGRRLLSLGDTLLLEGAWQGLRPDVLVVPIGGFMTMDVDEALRAVDIIKPSIVVPAHYNWYVLFYRHPADVKRFAEGVSALGYQCKPLARGESCELPV